MIAAARPAGFAAAWLVFCPVAAQAGPVMTRMFAPLILAFKAILVWPAASLNKKPLVKIMMVVVRWAAMTALIMTARLIAPMAAASWPKARTAILV